MASWMLCRLLPSTIRMNDVAGAELPANRKGMSHGKLASLPRRLWERKK